MAEPAAHLATDRVAGEVPGGVLAEVAHRVASRRGGRRAGGRGAPSRRTPRRARASAAPVGRASAATRSPNSHGRPRQPRPMTTPSQPVWRIIATASAASQMSPLPSTGISGTAGLQLADRVPVGGAGVVLLGGAGVQGDGRHALLGGDAAGLHVGEQRVEQALAELDRDRHAVRCGRGHRGAHDGPQQLRLGRHGRAAAAAGDLRRRAAEVHVDVVDAALARTAGAPPRRPSPGRCRRAAGCAAARRRRTSSSARSWRCRARRPWPSPSR